jgi:dipeptidyl aminopeptidase/acylaminoacyl peptidase
VHGYVVKPANFDPAKKYPVAFLIHGGPQGSFGNLFHYRWNAQTYAGAGYAVVMIDFHGSTGYGQAFTDAISQHWGDRPLEDLQKGWAFATGKYGFLDKDRACALGGSYGGFMVNWIASQWKEPWKCLVDHDGIFDSRFMGYSTEELWFSEWENGGPPFQAGTTYSKFNPADHVDQWSVPDPGGPGRPGLPRAAGRRHRHVHGPAAQGRAQQAAVLPQREPLGAEGPELGAVARRSAEVARPMDQGRARQVIRL